MIKKPVQISVIITSYNYEKYIGETLNSLVKQTFQPHEIIVVDDGSRDNSVSLIQSFKQRYNYIHLYTHPNHTNRGLAASVQLGITKATGQYIAFCESDDYWTPDHMEHLQHMIQKHPEARFIINGIQVVNLSGNKTYDSYISQCDAFLQKHSGRNIFVHLGQNYIPTFSAACIDRSLLVDVDFQAPYPAWLDFWLWRQIGAMEAVYYIRHEITCWRKHNESYDATSKGVDFNDFIRQSDLCLIRRYGLLPLISHLHKARKRERKWLLRLFRR